MRAIFFLDDWMLDRRCDVDRVFPTPRQTELKGCADMGISTVIYDPEVKRFRAWSKKLRVKDAPARLYVGRTAGQAPDIDGVTYVYATEELAEGELVPSTVVETAEYDLIARPSAELSRKASLPIVQ